jgi:hypothetical protein
MCDQRYNPEKPLLPPFPLRRRISGFALIFLPFDAGHPKGYNENKL